MRGEWRGFDLEKQLKFKNWWSFNKWGWGGVEETLFVGDTCFVPA